MNIFMAISAEILPVAPIGRVVVMISVLVMDGQQMTVRLIEFPSASRADEPMEGQRSFAVVFTGRPVRLSFQFTNDIFRRSGGTSFAAAAFATYAPPFTAEGDLGHAMYSLPD